MKIRVGDKVATVSIRYVKALVSLTTEKNQSLYTEKLKTLAGLYTRDLEFRNMVNNPEVDNQDKLDIIKDIIKPDEVLTNFVNELLKEERINLIKDIYEKYQEQIDRLNKVINIEIITAMKISDTDANKIAKKFKDMYQANKVNYQIKIDKDVIGGIKVIIDGKVYDSTLETKLEGLFGN